MYPTPLPTFPLLPRRIPRAARPTLPAVRLEDVSDVWPGFFSAHATTLVVNSYPNSLHYTLVLSHNIEHHRSCSYLWLSIRCLCDNQLLSACALRTLSAQQTYLVRGSCHCDFFIDSLFTQAHYTLRPTRFICSANEKPMVGRVGLEPTLFPVCLIYSQVPSPLGYLPICRSWDVECGRVKIWKNFQFLPARILRINTPRTVLSWCIYLPRIRTIYHPTP